MKGIKMLKLDKKKKAIVIKIDDTHKPTKMAELNNI